MVDLLGPNQGLTIKRSILILLLACAGKALAAPVRVSIDAQGTGSDLILQAYTTCLRNTPDVQIVPLGLPTEALIQITSMVAKNQEGKIGYAWANATIDPVTKIQLDGPVVVTTGPAYREILEQAASSVLQLDRTVLSPLRSQAKE